MITIHVAIGIWSFLNGESTSVPLLILCMSIAEPAPAFRAVHRRFTGGWPTLDPLEPLGRPILICGLWTSFVSRTPLPGQKGWGCFSLASLFY